MQAWLGATAVFSHLLQACLHNEVVAQTFTARKRLPTAKNTRRLPRMPDTVAQETDTCPARHPASHARQGYICRDDFSHALSRATHARTRIDGTCNALSGSLVLLASHDMVVRRLRGLPPHGKCQLLVLSGAMFASRHVDCRKHG